jgi:hypothetical protein
MLENVAFDNVKPWMESLKNYQFVSCVVPFAFSRQTRARFKLPYLIPTNDPFSVHSRAGFIVGLSFGQELANMASPIYNGAGGNISLD